MLTGLLAFLVVLLALLAIPVTVFFDLAWPGGRANDIRLHWGFGLVRTQLPASGSGAKRHEQSNVLSPTHASPRRRAETTNVWAAIRQPTFRRRVLRFLGDSWTAFHKHDVWLRMRIGLEDPADTGKLWAVLGPVSGALATVRSVTAVVDPEFQRETFEVEARGRVHVIPLRLLYLVVALSLSPALWRGVRAMRTAPG